MFIKGFDCLLLQQEQAEKGEVIFITSDELLLLSLQSNSYSAAAVSCSADNAGLKTHNDSGSVCFPTEEENQAQFAKQQ